MWSSWRWFSCWIAAQSSGSAWARLLLEGNMALPKAAKSKYYHEPFRPLPDRRGRLGARPQRFAVRHIPSAPVAPERLEQSDGCDEAPAEYDHRSALVVEPRRLNRHDVDEAHEARLVLVGRKDDRFARGAHRLLLDLRLLLEDTQRREVVLDFLESREHGLAILRDGC